MTSLTGTSVHRPRHLTQTAVAAAGALETSMVLAAIFRTGDTNVA